MKLLILEGITGSGKTRVLTALRHRLADYRGAVLILPETFTERVLEPLAEASPMMALTWLDTLIGGLAALQRVESDAPPGAEALVVLERAHLSIGVDVAGVAASDILARETGWLGLGECHLAWFEVPPEAILARSVLDPATRRNELWRRHLATLGATPAAQAAHFAGRQTAMAALAMASRLPRRNLRWQPGAEDDIAGVLLTWIGLPQGGSGGEGET